MRDWLSRKLGQAGDITVGARIAVTILALMSAMQLAWFSYQNREIAECQARYNDAVTEVLQERVRIAERDRQSVVTLAREIIESTGPRQNREALARFVLTQDNLTQQRAEQSLPTLPEC